MVIIQWKKKRGEPQHDKTNKVTVRPAKTQISLGIRPVWSESLLSAWRKLGLSYPLSAQRSLWSDWAAAQADLSLCWAHTHFVGFVMSWLRYIVNQNFFTKQELDKKSQQSKEMLQQLESQAREGTSQIKQLESALQMCQDEIKTYIEALEESKGAYDRELSKRDDKVGTGPGGGGGESGRMCQNEIKTYIEALKESKGMYDRKLSQRDDKVGAGPRGGELGRMCQDEIKTYIEALEESKGMYDRELSQCDDKVGADPGGGGGEFGRMCQDKIKTYMAALEKSKGMYGQELSQCDDKIGAGRGRRRGVWEDVSGRDQDIYGDTGEIKGNVWIRVITVW